VLESRARFLALRPYHGRVFANLLSDLRARGVVGAWIARFEREAALGDGNAAVLVARLLAAAGRLEEALERLGELEGEDPLRDALVGRLRLGAGEPALALGSLARAAAGLEPGEQRRAVLVLALRAHLILGDRAGAAQALNSLAADDPLDLGLLLDVAARASRAGLLDLALTHLSAAKELAVGDAQARSRVLTSLGRLHELRLEPELALDTYNEALALLGREHWLEEQLFLRTLSLHRRLGSLARWSEDLQRQITAAPQRLEFVLRLARVLVATARAEQAIELLANAAERFSRDEGLAQRRLELLRAHGTGEQRIALLQERLVRVPGDLESRLTLAEEFESLERRAAAELQWRRALELRPRDAGLLRRVARTRAKLGAGDVVLEHLERALELEPTDLSIPLELAQAQRLRGHLQQARAVLSNAGRTFDGDAGALEELTSAWLELGEPDDRARAEVQLRRALALRGADSPQRSALETRLAGILLDPVYTDEGRTAEGRALLRARIRRAADLDEVWAELETLLGTYNPFNRASLYARETARAVSGEGGLDAWRVAIALGAQTRDATRQLVLLDAYAESAEYDRGARELRVDLLESMGALQVAAAELADLAQRFPRAARPWHLRRAELLAAAGQGSPALAAVEMVLAGNFGHAAALEEAAEVLHRLGHTARAVEVLGWALNLDRADAARHLAMARLCREDEQIERAVEHLRAAHRHGARETRENAAKLLHALLVDQRGLGRELERLGNEVRANPFDLEGTFLLSELHILERQFRQALEVLGASLEARPFEVALLERRAALLRRLGLHRAAADDLEALAALSESPLPEVAYQLLEAHLASGEPAAALQVARTCDDPVRAAELLAEYGRATEAVTLLEEARQGSHVDPLVERTLGDRLADLGRLEGAIDAFERYLAGSPPEQYVLRRLGDLHHALGHEERVLQVGLQLLELTRGLRSTRSWFVDRGLFEEWVGVRCEQVAAQPRSTAVLSLLSELEDLDSPPFALLQLLSDLERGARQDGVSPPGRPPLFWAEELRHRELALVAAVPVLARRRMIDLRKVLDEALSDPHATDSRDARVAADLALLVSTTGALEAQDEARFERALETWPASLLLRSDFTRALAHAGKYFAAALQAERLERLLASTDFLAQAREEHARLRRLQAAALRRTLPTDLAFGAHSAVEEALVDLEHGLARGRGIDRSLPLDRAEARRDRAELLALAGESAAAEALLSHADPERPEDLEATLLDAVACLRASQFGLAEMHVRVLDRALRRIEETTAGAGILRHAQTDQHLWSALGQIYRSLGKAALAYDLLRGLDRPQQARQVASTRETYGQCVAHFEQRLAAAEERIDDHPRTSAAWWSAARALHDAGVKLVELHEWTENVSAADGVLTTLAAHLPEDPTVLALAALFAERAGDRARALELHRRTLVALEVPPGQPPQRVDWIRPRVPVSEPNARRSATWHGLAQSVESFEGPPTLAHRLAVLRLELEGKQLDVARSTLEHLVDEVGPPTGVFVRSLQHVLNGYDLGPEASGFFAELTRLAPGNLQVLRDFVGALWDEEALERASTALEAFSSANPALAWQEASDLERLRNHTRELIQELTDH